MKKILYLSLLLCGGLSVASCLDYDEPGDELNMNQQIVPYETPNSAPIINLVTASFVVMENETCDVDFSVKDQDGDDFTLSVEDDSNCSSILSATSVNGKGKVAVSDDKLSVTVTGARSGANVTLHFAPIAVGTVKVKLVAKDINDDPEKVNTSDRTITFTVNAAQ